VNHPTDSDTIPATADGKHALLANKTVSDTIPVDDDKNALLGDYPSTPHAIVAVTVRPLDSYNEPITFFSCG
jgi:hypothetical protein